MFEWNSLDSLVEQLLSLLPERCHFLMASQGKFSFIPISSESELGVFELPFVGQSLLLESFEHLYYLPQDIILEIGITRALVKHNMSNKFLNVHIHHVLFLG